MKISDSLTEKLLVVASKISNQKHMYAIKTAFTTLMPVIITGAFCTLIVNVVCSTETTGISLAKVQGFSWLEMFTDLFNAAILTNTDIVANPNYNPADLNIISMSFWDTYGNIGGSGCVVGLLIACLVFSKREDYKQVAKLSIAPNIFNISETLHFGLPIMLNPLLMIPFIITPLATMAFGYFMTIIGFSDILVYAFPWTTPPFINAWIASGGSIGTVITQALCIVISIAIYTPFVIIANKQKDIVSQ